MSSFSTIPSHVGLPQELSLASIDPIMPPEAKSNSIKVYAINNASVSADVVTDNHTNAGGINSEIAFPQNEISFDLPCSQSSDTFLDCRQSSLSFRMVVTVKQAGAVHIKSGTLRSSAYSYFDNMRIVGGNGSLLEYINEYGLTADTLIQGMIDEKEGLFSYGFKSNFGQNSSITAVGGSSFTNTGHDIPVLSKGSTLTTGESQSFSYSVPLLSGVIGSNADRFFPIGLVKKMLVTLTTAGTLPFTIEIGTGGTTGLGCTLTVQLTDFCLNLETIRIGSGAMSQILSTLPDGKMYIHGSSYKSTTSILPANSTGVLNLPVGITGSSVKSLFTRFHETGTPSVNRSCWGKFSSKCPNLNQYGFNIGGQQIPSTLYNPILRPAECYRSFLQALGMFNSAEYKSGLNAISYHKLVQGGTPTAFAQSGTQDQYFKDASDNVLYQSTFLLGENLESVPRRGLLSGMDLTFQKVSLILGTNNANTNPINVYVTALLDIITIIDVASGETITIM